MRAIIRKQTFDGLDRGSSIFDKNGKRYLIEIPNCGGPGKYTTHLFRDTRGQCSYLFHDGENIRIHDTDDKELDGQIVGELTIYDGNLNNLQDLINYVKEKFICDGGVYPDLKSLPKERHRNFIIKHSTLHMMKSAGKLAAECEHFDHGGEFNDEVAKETVLKNFTNLCKIAEMLNMTALDILKGVPEVMKSK